MRLGPAILLLALFASPAPAQTRPSPVIDDPSRDAPLPTRRGGAATQATLAGGTPRVTTTTSDPLDLKRLALALAVVLGAMYVTHRVWKRLGMPGAANRAAGSLQVISRLSLSPKQQLILVRVGRRVVLVGNSGTQMNALCDISDPEEAAGILGLAATEREESVTATFDSVLGGEEKRFDEEANVGLAASAPDDAALANTRDELNDMMEKVRSLSRSFRPDAKGQ